MLYCLKYDMSPLPPMDLSQLLPAPLTSPPVSTGFAPKLHPHPRAFSPPPAHPRWAGRCGSAVLRTAPTAQGLQEGDRPGCEAGPGGEVRERGHGTCRPGGRAHLASCPPVFTPEPSPRPRSPRTRAEARSGGTKPQVPPALHLHELRMGGGRAAGSQQEVLPGPLSGAPAGGPAGAERS